MKERLRSINRVLAFQKQLGRLAEWKLAALQQQESELDRQQRDLVRFLDEDSAFSGLFATTLMKRLRGVAEAKVRVAGERVAQEEASVDGIAAGRPCRAPVGVRPGGAPPRRRAAATCRSDRNQHQPAPRKPPVSLLPHLVSGARARGTDSVSIKPPSDLLIDVVNAADPVKAQVATEKLTRLAPFDAVSKSGFAETLGTMHVAPAPNLVQLRAQLTTASAKRATPIAPHDARTKAYKGLEALVLQNLIETMLPKDTTSFFGKGTGSEMWRSMMAQQLATQIANSVDLGIAKSMAAHSPHHAAKPNAVTASNAATVPMSTGRSSLTHDDEQILYASGRQITARQAPLAAFVRRTIRRHVS